MERLQQLEAEGVDWSVLTTKTQAFTAELLNSLGLHPWRLDGREAGAKPQVLLQLQQQRGLWASWKTAGRRWRRCAQHQAWNNCPVFW